MRKHLRWLMAAILLVTGLAAFTPATPAGASTGPAMSAWAFCGVKYEVGVPANQDPYAFQKAQAMAQSGITATHGYCFTPPGGYTAAFPGTRYGTKAQQFGTMYVNSHYGMKTIIYDKDLWSENATVRNNAVAYWAPHAQWIEAIDMGDEFPCWDTSLWTDPANPGYGNQTQWAHLQDRAATLWNNVSANPASPLYLKFAYTTNFSPQWTMATFGINCVQRAFQEVYGVGINLGYDEYDQGTSQWWAWWLATNVSGGNALVCAISVTQTITGAHVNNPATLTQSNIKTNMGYHRANGCDRFLIFNAGIAQNAPFAGKKSLSTAGAPFSRSDWGLGVLQGTTYVYP